MQKSKVKVQDEHHSAEYIQLTSHARVAVHQDIGLPTKLHVDEQWQKGKHKSEDEQNKNLREGGKERECVRSCMTVTFELLWVTYMMHVALTLAKAK